MEVNCSTKYKLEEPVVISDLISWLNKLPPGSKLVISELRSGEMGLRASWDEER